MGTAAGTCAACASGHFDASVGNNGNCVVHSTPTCGNQVGGSTRLVAGTATADASCSACSDNTFAASDASNCVAKTVCGNQATGVTRTTTTAATLITDTVCETCTAGTFGATYTCTSTSDSRVSACDSATPTKTIGSAGAMD